jgi:hypothetical protein
LRARARGLTVEFEAALPGGDLGTETGLERALAGPNSPSVQVGRVQRVAVHLDPDNISRAVGIDPEKQRERQLHRAELEALKARTEHAESEAKWGKIGAMAAAVSAIVSVIALVIALL